MSFIKEFKQFAMKGNVVDLAVGVIIGAAFGKIVSSLVADIIMPLLGLLVGGVDFSKLRINLGSPVDGAKAATLNYGMFIQTIFDFCIVAFAIFLFVKLMNRLKREEPPHAATKPEDVLLLQEIRDLLKEKK